NFGNTSDLLRRSPRKTQRFRTFMSPLRNCGKYSNYGSRPDRTAPLGRLSQPRGQDYGTTWKRFRLASTPGTGGPRSWNSTSTLVAVIPSKIPLAEPTG